jgi:hypothetical protein
MWLLQCEIKTLTLSGQCERATVTHHGTMPIGQACDGIVCQEDPVFGGLQHVGMPRPIKVRCYGQLGRNKEIEFCSTGTGSRMLAGNTSLYPSYPVQPHVPRHRVTQQLIIVFFTALTIATVNHIKHRIRALGMITIQPGMIIQLIVDGTTHVLGHDHSGTTRSERGHGAGAFAPKAHCGRRGL